MRFKDIASRVTGISTPIGGLSWDPPIADRDVAVSVVRQLEDKRVLYQARPGPPPRRGAQRGLHHGSTDVGYCVKSVQKIREILTSALTPDGLDSELTAVLQYLRAMCRDFLDSVEPDSGTHALHVGLDRLRPEFAWGLAWIAVAYKIDVDDDLAALLTGHALDKYRGPDQKTGEGSSHTSFPSISHSQMTPD